MFAQQLAAHVVAGELYLTDWSSEKGASVKVSLFAGSIRKYNFKYFMDRLAHIGPYVG